MMQKGKKIGDYLVEAELSKGGMGTLYYGIDTMLNREVTLKVIHPQYSKNSLLITKFRNEAITQAQMNHPNIVTVFSFVHIDEFYIIVMEYINGTDLYEILKKKKFFPVKEAIFFLKQILRGLNYAHERQIIHGDIKPRNIMITQENRVKISDFGIAKIFGPHSKIEEKLILGTPWYASPEQILGRNVDFRSDLYSVGITFYEMVTGKVPFNPETGLSIDIEKAHLFEFPPMPSHHMPKINKEVENFILKAIDKKPEFRYQSANDMLNEIDKLPG